MNGEQPLANPRNHSRLAIRRLLTPAALVPSAQRHSRAIAQRPCKCVARFATGGSRPPLLTACVERRKTHSPASAIIVPHGGLTPPRSCSGAVLPPTQLRLLRCTNAHAQERRRKPAVVAVATLQRRSTRHSHLVIVPGNRNGTRQPAVAAATVIAMRFAGAASAVSRVSDIVIASTSP